MKPRRVVITLEVSTDRTIKDIRNKKTWSLLGMKLIQVHANAIRPAPGKP